jgi:hypothetical protein
MNIDVRLDQDAQSWLTAKGFAPTTLFQPTPGAMEGNHVTPPLGEAINIDVASSQIDLGVVQGFTSDVTNVGHAAGEFQGDGFRLRPPSRWGN